MKTTDSKFPSPSELERDFNEFLSKKYGGSVRVGSIFPAPKGEDLTEEGEVTKSEPLKIKFDLKPEELEAYLDKYVIKQAEAKEVLATKICTHFHRIRLSADREPLGNIKNNIILIGPTGVGKTYLIKLIAAKIGVPFVKGDATKFSETGYVGGDVEQLVRDLVHEADGNIELAQYGIIYIDEIDKIAASNSSVGPDVSRTGVQRNLLKLMEETEVDLKVPHDLASQLEAAMKFQKTGKVERKKINTKNILFIVSGAFNGLEEIVRKRLNEQKIGFGSQIQSREEQRNQYLKQVKAEDLIEYGFESEFIGRLPVIAMLDDLKVDDLHQILTNPNCSVIASKKRDFKSYNIDIRFEDEALWEIARRAYQERTGARGLVSALERVLLKFEKKLPSTTINRLVVTKQMVADPAGELAKLLANPDDERIKLAYQRLLEEEKKLLRASVHEYEEEFNKHHASQMKFSPQALELIINRTIAQDAKLERICDEVYQIQSGIRQVAAKFSELYEVSVRFDDEAVDLITQMVFEQGVAVEEVCHRVLKNYQHGLKLIRNKSKEFVVTKHGVEDPEGYLNQIIKQYFSQHPDQIPVADKTAD
jgi:endopeptidase Clp ATP-binding regulatory subunit ClpX